MTSTNAQTRYYISSAGVSTSDILRAIRDRGRRGGDPTLGYLEFADIEPPSCVLGDDCEHLLGTPGCTLTSTAAAYEPRHLNPDPKASKAAAALAFVKVLGVGLMYRGKHRDTLVAAWIRNDEARHELEATS